MMDWVYHESITKANYCDTCGHQYSDVCGVCETLDGVPVKYLEKKKINADRIRAKNDEELAKWICDLGVDCAYCKIASMCYELCKNRDCGKAWLEWLKQEAEE